MDEKRAEPVVRMADLYWNKETNKGYTACALFTVAVKRLHKYGVDFVVHFPNKEKSPWHLQLIINAPSEKDQARTIVNVWPHKHKYQFDGQTSKESPLWGGFFEDVMEHWERENA